MCRRILHTDEQFEELVFIGRRGGLLLHPAVWALVHLLRLTLEQAIFTHPVLARVWTPHIVFLLFAQEAEALLIAYSMLLEIAIYF